jgi:hypothetical protein
MRLTRPLPLPALLAGCGGERTVPAMEVPAAAVLDSAAAPVRAPADSASWVTIAEQSMADVRSTPSTLRVSSDSLRVITSVGGSESPYAPGLVVANFLSDPLTPPVATVRGEPRFLDSTTVDTTVVRVPRGELYFFIPQHYGVKDWSVVVQERRAEGG